MSTVFDSKLTEQAIKALMNCPQCLKAIEQSPDRSIPDMFSAYLRVRKGIINPKLVDWNQVTKQVKSHVIQEQ